MSRLYYFASDTMLDERPNPYVKLLSINQAIQEGIKVDLNIFNDDVDMDEPGVILSCWDEEKLQYPNIYAINKEDYFEDIGTKKQNCTELQWVYSSDSVNVVLEYIQDHLKKRERLNYGMFGWGIMTYQPKSRNIIVK